MDFRVFWLHERKTEEKTAEEVSQAKINREKSGNASEVLMKIFQVFSARKDLGGKKMFSFNLKLF